MNLERLRAVQAEEREADSLRPLADSFYQEVAEYLAELRSRRAAAAESAEDPFGDEDVRRLTDEIETAEEVAEAIYERRVGKLVKRASLAAAGMPADEEGLTAEEAVLFSDLVDQIEAHRSEVLAAFDADGSGADGLSVDAEQGDVEGSLDATDVMEGEDATMGGGPSDASRSPPEDGGTATAGDNPGADDPGADPDDRSDATESTDGGGADERVTLRITQDVGEVFGVDERVYDLSDEDVVTLPSANAKPLLDRDAAEKIS